LMDREKPGASKSQVGFFDFVVLPLFQALARAAPAASDALHTVTDNYQRWNALETTGVAGGNAGGELAPRSASPLKVSPSSEERSAAPSTDEEDDISTRATFAFGPEICTSVPKRSGRARLSCCYTVSVNSAELVA
jgi:hypothetical protein